jgi:hypothetical protein
LTDALAYFENLQDADVADTKLQDPEMGTVRTS